MLSKKVYIWANWSNFLSQMVYSSQNLVILIKWDPSGWFLDIQNPARAHSVTPREDSLKNFSRKCVAGTQNFRLGLYREQILKFQWSQNL